MIIQFMGPQACGKGTQGKMLGELLGVPLIGMGAILRDILPTDKNYKKIHEYMDRGDLIPNDIVAELLKKRVAESDCKKGYILDGYTREMDQIRHFDPKPDWVIVVAIPREESIKRISGRRVCTANGQTYNIYTLPKEELAKCPGPLVQREDDKEEAINKRLNIYYNQTSKVLDYYRGVDKLIEVDGMGTPQQVFSRVVLALETCETYKNSLVAPKKP